MKRTTAAVMVGLMMALVAVLASPVTAAPAGATSGMRPATSGSSSASAPSAAGCGPLLDFRFGDLISGNPVSLCDFAGKVVLVVNTASHCGFTPQYEGLEALYKQYQPRGLVVVGFPSNDFGQQEPDGNQKIAEFCRLNYGVSFPMFEKSDVVGTHANALYAALTRQTGVAPDWNFHKYLIDRSGRAARSFPSDVAPQDDTLRTAIEKALSVD